MIYKAIKRAESPTGSEGQGTESCLIPWDTHDLISVHLIEVNGILRTNCYNIKLSY